MQKKQLNRDFYIDLLFYHYKLRCFVVIELKAREFDPRDAGQINFYLSAVDKLLKQEGDRPTMGLLLCQSKNNVVAEYALQDLNKPIGVAGYEVQLVEKLPKEFKSNLPTVQDIEVELGKIALNKKLSKKRASVSTSKKKAKATKK